MNLLKNKTLLKRRTKLTNKQSEKIIEEYKAGQNAYKLAKKYNVVSTTIYNILKRKEIPIRSYSQVNRIYLLNENYFEKINNKNKAYWLGFCFADGYLYKKKYLNITLSGKDEIFLNKFKNALNSSYPIKYIGQNKGGYTSKYGRVSLKIFCKKLCEDLIQNGYLQKYIHIPKKIPYYLLNHFIRGFFDGDGSISIRNRCNLKRPELDISLYGSESFINDLKEKLPFYCNNKIIKRKGTFSMSMGNSTALKFLNWIYKDSDSSIRMKRKYKKYNNFISNNYIIKKRIKLTELQVKEIVRRYNKGESGITLANEYKINKTTVYTLLKKRNVMIRNKMKLVNKQAKEILIRYQTGESGTKIAKNYNVHPSTIYRLLKNINI